MNEKQIDILEKVLINTANVTLATLVLGNFLSSKALDLTLFSAGISICALSVGWGIC